jgi:hypothetical protein
MTNKDYPDEESEPVDVEQNPETLREDDEISDTEEGFLQGYESEQDEEEEEKEDKEDEFDI